MLKFLLSVVSIYVAALIVPGVEIHGFLISFVVAIVLALLNATLGIVLKILTFPMNFLTLGLVGFVINVFMITLTDKFIDGFYIHNFIDAAIFALVVALLNFILHSILKKDRKEN